MDPADWLQSLPTKDGAKFLTGGEGAVHLSNEQFVQKYNESARGQDMLRKLETPIDERLAKVLDKDMLKKRYAASTLLSIKVVCVREFLLWWRDRYTRIDRVIQDLLMGIIVGSVSNDEQTKFLTDISVNDYLTFDFSLLRYPGLLANW